MADGVNQKLVEQHRLDFITSVTVAVTNAAQEGMYYASVNFPKSLEQKPVVKNLLVKFLDEQGFKYQLEGRFNMVSIYWKGED